MHGRSSGVRSAVDSVVLLVEDDPDIRDALVELLVDAGYTVRAASTLEEARTFLARSLPSVLLADLQLPDGSSEELFTALAEEGAPIPIVVISAASNGRDVAAKHGAEYLAKPFSLDDVTSVTARLTAKGVKSAR